MPVQIGARNDAGFDDPFELLSSCHRRIEMFLGVLVQAADLGPERTGEAERAAIGRALAYFRDAAPKHTADEEESVFPRLREAGAAEALSAIAPLEADHVAAAALHAELDEIGREWLASGALPLERLERFRQIAGRLRELYAAHIEIEDRDLFPAARRALDAAAVRAIGREMSERRRPG